MAQGHPTLPGTTRCHGAPHPRAQRAQPCGGQHLGRGALVEVLPRLRLPSPMAYWLLSNPRSTAQPEVAAFSEWLLAEARVMALFMDEKLG
jgi:DNA-binding transcriptional LysR family regulator